MRALIELLLITICPCQTAPVFRSKKAKKREFDFGKCVHTPYHPLPLYIHAYNPYRYHTRKVALRIAYVGAKYQGLSSNSGADSDESIEARFFTRPLPHHFCESD